MTQTIHGHHIPRTGRNDEDKNKLARNCGGVDACGICRMETKKVLMQKYPEDYVEEK